jgi:hypothetical protein
VIRDGFIGDKEEATSASFLLSAFPPLLHKEGTRATVIDQGTKSKRRGAKSAEDFAEKNLDDLYRAFIAPRKTPRFPSRALHLRVSLKQSFYPIGNLTWCCRQQPKIVPASSLDS